MSIRANDLRCERCLNPIGIGMPSPRLSWRIEADEDETDVLQHAWQVEVSDAGGVVWDTGRVDGRSQQMRYAGPAFSSRAVRRWRVRVWTSAGDSDWSEEATFETGLLEAVDWSARMITASPETAVAAFRTAVDLPADAVSGRLFITAHGSFVARINGRDVGQEVLAPGWTAYARRLAVRTHDVTALLHEGRNEIEVFVGPGWFSGRIGFGVPKPIYGDYLGLLAQLEATVRNGEVVRCATNEDWTASSTPYLLAEIYDGETFDARRTAESTAVEVVDFDYETLVAPPVPPTRRTETLQPTTTIVTDGVIRLDFGQNLVGRLRVTLRDAAPGAEIVMRHAEVLGPDGRLFTAPLRTARATDTYIARGDRVEVYEPTFTFHGFRYAEITGIDPGNVDVEAVVVHSDLERIGTFACSDPLINQLHSNVVWGQRGNFLSVPTDCPQRDERLGWTGDAQVFSPTASFLYDCQTFWENWLADLAADQREDGMVPPVIPDIGIGMNSGAAGWGDAAVVVPWTTYEIYGDDSVLADALESMQAWVDWVYARLDDDLRWRRDFQFGDWLDPDAPTAEPWRAKARFDLVATAYACRVTEMLARSAAIVGEKTSAARYGERADALREAWWRNYRDEAATSQTGCALAICFDLVSTDEDRRRFGEALVALIEKAGDHLATGFLGTPLLLPALTQVGRVDVAYRVLGQKTSPSWLYQVLAGATTIWERWDALRPDGSVPMDALGVGSGASMVSFNHYAYGSVADWLHRTVAGLAPDPAEPGYRHVLVQPRPGGGLTSASAELMSRYGRTAVAWNIDGDEFVLDVTIPPNATATITLPDDTVTTMGSGTGSFRSAMRA